ncbi:hypothetical protein KJ940_18575, partial [Myxococcota bacterium]|nr:hypothetical protein [Myxococcota bacterium]
SGADIDVEPPLASDWASSSVVLVQHVPHYTAVDIQPGALVAADHWAGAGGDDWGGDGGWGGGSMADACWGGCFSNQDCAEGFICSDIDFGEPCCLEGVSEGLPVGAPCQAEGHAIECASSICIEGPDGPRCSDVCEAAEDCPQGMRRCERIPLSGSDERWCLFE